MNAFARVFPRAFALPFFSASFNGRFAGHRIPLNFDYRQRVRAIRRRGEKGEGNGLNTGLANPEAKEGGGGR